MTTYRLYIESGPKKRKTYVHIPEVFGCMANGPTTEEAVAAAPEAIAQFRRFLHRHGAAIDLDDPIETVIAEHVTEGMWLGNGSPYYNLETDYLPLEDDDLADYLNRLEWIAEELVAWAETQTPEALDVSYPGSSRTSGAILLHFLGAKGGALSAALGGAPGFSALHGAVERGELPITVGLRRATEMTRERIAGTTYEQRNTMHDKGSGRQYNLRKALRRMIEHDWEHMTELARRAGGPTL